MSAKILLVAIACAFAMACDNGPPMLGAGDAAHDAPSGDVSTANDASSDGTAGDSSQPACTLTSPPSNPTCATCVQSSCCATANACSGNPDCIGYVACIRVCYPPDGGVDGGGDGGEGSSSTCPKTCQTKYPAGINDGIVLIDCEDNKCAGKCN